jgi:hypothetical protein
VVPVYISRDCELKVWRVESGSCVFVERRRVESVESGSCVHIERLRVGTVESGSCVQREDEWGLKCTVVDLV